MGQEGRTSNMVDANFPIANGLIIVPLQTKSAPGIPGRDNLKKALASGDRYSGNNLRF